MRLDRDVTVKHMPKKLDNYLFSLVTIIHVKHPWKYMLIVHEKGDLRVYSSYICSVTTNVEHTVQTVTLIILCWYSNFLSSTKERLNALLLCGQDWRGVSLTLFKVYENIWMLKCHWLCAFNRLWLYEKSVF